MRNCCSPSTASKQPERFPVNYPKRIVSGKGAYITDENGKEYLDFCCSLGPIILGYRNEEVDEAVKKAITDYGTIFSLSHPKEQELAEVLCEMIPSAEMVRFAQNGKDPTEAAVRLSRHITGREKVLSFSYHGASDVFMACTKADKGVPDCLKLTISEFDYNENFELDPKDLPAAIIMEPHTIRMPGKMWLEKIRAACDLYGIILIFDEVVSFPRYKGYSAQAQFNVIPDLTCISKGMANGYPISALAGKERYMKELKDGGVFFSTTFGGNLIGVSAALKTLEIIKRDNIVQKIEHLGKWFKASVRSTSQFKLKGIYQRQFFDCDDDVRQKIWQEAIKEGIFFHVPIFFNASMTMDDMERAGKILNSITSRLDKIQIEGEPIKDVFKKR